MDQKKQNSMIVLPNGSSVRMSEIVAILVIPSRKGLQYVPAGKPGVTLKLKSDSYVDCPMSSNVAAKREASHITQLIQEAE